MKIAVVCPIGPLNRYGYEHVATDCIASMVDFADHVFLMQSARDKAGVEAVLRANGGRVTLVSDERTWFNGERFDAQKVMDNADLGADLALAEGYDVAICLMVNWYVPPKNRRGLRLACERAVETGWAWLYRRDQLGLQMFHVNTRLPWIIALRPGRPHYGIDSIHWQDGTSLDWGRGAWPEYDEQSVIDLQLEMTRADMQERLEYVRFHKDLLPKRPTHFEWDYWKRYYVEKYHKKTLATDKPTGAGIVVAGQSARFVSSEILEALHG